MYNAVVHISLSKNVLHITTCSNFVPKCLDSGVCRTTFKAAKTWVSGYWPYQYGVPMKDIRRARVAVIWAEIPKSATQQWKQKNIIITIMPNSNLIKYTLVIHTYIHLHFLMSLDLMCNINKTRFCASWVTWITFCNNFKIKALDLN